MNVRFDVNKGEYAIISAIAARAVNSAKEAGWTYAQRDAEMDLAACHCNGTPLRLTELLAADDFNFSHDVFGIRRNLDRKTGKLRDHFSPRYTVYAKPGETCKGCEGAKDVDSDTGLCPDCAAWGEAILADAAQRGRR